MNDSSCSFAAHAVLTLADIKAASAAFDRGDTNIFEAIDAIVIACEAYRAAIQSLRTAA
jgi:hypothetical protein